MPDPLRVDTLPTLSYYVEPQAAALKTLVRLTLWAEAVNGILIAIGDVAQTAENWPQHLTTLGQTLIWCAQLFASLMTTALCLFAVRTRLGRIALMLALIVGIILDASNYFSDLWLGAGIVGIQIAEFGGYFLQDSILPLLVLVILIRKDMRPPARPAGE